MMTIDVVQALYGAKTGKPFDMEDFKVFMAGKTVSLVGEERLYYLYDVLRFCRGES